ncbi:hypothetical protein CHCC15290_1322 [Bacillus licheniformis]|uniref:Uncharacterized protein n=1 Tax=Bacillus licheniformis TaxID=1402 RepID=A0A8B5Y6G6_BACLI|nr:hypothetical protein B4092_0010 [Bacillus licheniformis]TWN18470.1 hypothetical protein CHCC14564_4142 [Bacillus licheniformis LMG 17339]KYC79735.1 hypothetical protein B4091_0010 [Bacillus licheniformis]KYC97553.1 hypothetical protein B4164_0011 [Bacillus licheniformis]OLF90939.1 hypothetical protein B4089_2726 [Bacillus licheniformis]
MKPFKDKQAKRADSLEEPLFLLHIKKTAALSRQRQHNLQFMLFNH